MPRLVNGFPDVVPLSGCRQTDKVRSGMNEALPHEYLRLVAENMLRDREDCPSSFVIAGFESEDLEALSHTFRDLGCSAELDKANKCLVVTRNASTRFSWK